MLKRKDNKYYLTHYEEINESIKKIQEFFRERLEADKILKKVNYQEYEKLTKKIDLLTVVPATFSLEEILKFSQLDLVRVVETIPKNILELEKAGYSVSGFSHKQEIISTNKITEQIYNLHFYTPKPQEYMICKPEKLTKEFGAFLTKNKLFNIIALFRYEELAAPLRAQLGVPPLRRKTSVIANCIQMYGLTPATNFIKIKPAAKDTIIYLGNGKKQIYYDTQNYLNLDSRFTGLNANFLCSNIFPIETATAKYKSIKTGTGKIYQTFDEVLYREVTSPFAERLFRGPSPIANGYNTLLNKKFSKRIGAPLISVMTMSIMKEFNRQKYIDFRTRAIKMPRNKIIDKFLEMLIETLDFGGHKVLERELHIGLVAERIKLERKLEIAKSLEDFFEDIIEDKDNFILKFERKIKIYNAGREKKVDGGKASKKSNKKN